jgi:hypothetical protein
VSITSVAIVTGGVKGSEKLRQSGSPAISRPLCLPPGIRISWTKPQAK